MSAALALLPGGLSRANPARQPAADFHAARAAAAAVARAEEARQDAIDTAEIGPWYADLECLVTGDKYADLPDTTQAKILRALLREAGVKARINVRRYSMASGLSLSPPSGSEWSDRDAEIVASVLPGVAYIREYRDGARWCVDCSLYPRDRHDRSDLQSDYHAPGGFRVSLAWSARCAYLISCAVAA